MVTYLQFEDAEQGFSQVPVMVVPNFGQNHVRFHILSGKGSVALFVCSQVQLYFCYNPTSFELHFPQEHMGFGSWKNI